MKVRMKILIIVTFLLLLVNYCKPPEQATEIITEYKVFEEAIPTDISFVDNNYGFISGSFEPSSGAAVIAKTSDGGMSWSVLPVIVDGYNSTLVLSIYAFSKDSIMATFNSSHETDRGVCLSTDGGLTWRSLYSFISSNAYTGLIFVDNNTGFVTGGNNIFKTSDKGINWINVFACEGLVGPDVLLFPEKNIGYAFGTYVADQSSFGSIYKTIDFGNTWSILGLFHKAVTCLSFKDKNVGYAFTFEHEVYKTIDGGINWTYLASIPEAGGYYSSVSNGAVNYFASGPTIFKTSDDFKSYEKIYTCKNDNSNLSTKAIQLSDNSIYILSSLQSVIKVQLTH